MKSTAIIIFILGFCLINQANAQNCPTQDDTGKSTLSAKRTLEGKLVYHDGLRQWFELKLDKPECGESSLQLIAGAGYAPSQSHYFDIFRGCRIRVTGIPGYSDTGYYSASVWQLVEQLKPVGDCKKQAVIPAWPKGKPNKDIKKYRVVIHVDTTEGDHPILVNVTDAGKELSPWQAYASYYLTGGFVLYGYCGKGFVVDELFEIKNAKPDYFTEPRDLSDAAAIGLDFDEKDGSMKQQIYEFGYSCIRALHKD